jgi:hypothetical protein
MCVFIAVHLWFLILLRDRRAFAVTLAGDGPNNMGLPVVPVRDAVLARGITINGLPVTLRPSGS